ncbi:MAG: NfeD family protein [Proteobacteria bacterium]|nr:NfeD family protein [Pseudomonadota bacterium]
MDFFEHIVFWHWWIAAGILLIIELSVPTFFFMWMGIAAVLVGLMLLVVPGMPLELQLVMFVVLSLVTIILWRRYREKNRPLSDHPLLNQRGQQYVGRVFTLEEAIVNGTGKVSVDDSTWRVKGLDMSVGNKVKVVDTEGVVLVVEAAG